MTAESIGRVLGTMAWLARGHQITTWARALWMVRGPQRLAAWLLPGYLFALVLAHLMPFDLTIRPLEIYRKYQEGRVQWILFATHATDPLALIQKDLENLVGFFPVGLLLTQLPGLGRRSRWSGMRVFGLGLATAGLIELLQLFVSSRFFETTDVVTGGLAVWAGWCVGTVCWRSEADPGISANARGVSSLQAWYPLGFLGWLAVLVLIGWQPFDFTADTAVAARRLQRLSLVPFADYYRGTEYYAFDQFVCKILLFFPLGAFVASGHPWGDRGRAGFLVMLTALGLAAGLEAG